MRRLPLFLAMFLTLPVMLLCGVTHREVKVYAGNIYADSIADLGFRLFSGDSLLQRDTVRGRLLIEEAASLGNPRAINNLAFLLLHSDPAHRDTLRALSPFRRAAEYGLPTAKAQLADMLREGVGAPPDTLEARRLYLEASTLGLSDAEMKLVNMDVERWRTIPSDSLLTLAQKYYPSSAPFAADVILGIILERDSTADGSPVASPVPPQATAAAILADAYARGRGVRYDYKKSLEYFYRAACQGDPSAQFILAETLDITPEILSIIGVLPYDPDNDSQRWYIMAARMGITDASQAYSRLLGKRKPAFPSPWK